jgi:signal transduction histidine kinase
MAAIIIGTIFSRNKYKIGKTKLETARLINSVIAHELGTPIASIKALTQKPETNDIIIHGNTLLKIRMLTNQLSKLIEMNKWKLNRNNTNNDAKNIASIYEIVIDSINDFPNNKEELEKIISVKLINDFEIRCDTLFIKHVILNLIQNSLRYVRIAPNPSIAITISTSDSFNFLFIRDNGSGIPKENLSKIFSEYFSTGSHNMGLGLYFCKTTIEAMGGKIFCKSVEGEYTEFTLKFPKVQGKDKNISI